MKSWKMAVGAAALAMAVGAADAQAQIGLWVGGGPSLPLGDLSDVAELGYNAQVSASFSLPVLPVALRADGMFNSFKADEDVAFAEAGSFRYLSGSVNAIINLPLPVLTPYAIGGVGMYKSEFKHDGDDDHDHGSSTDLGLNVGLGARLSLPGLGAFAEWRLHNVMGDGGADARFAPFTLGLRF